MDAPPPRAASAHSSSGRMPSRFAMISRKRPVPAEHLSFIRKSCTAPPDTPMTFVSCPPMSITRRSSRPVQKARAARVAGDLRDALSGVRHGDAPVPRRNTGVRFPAKSASLRARRGCSPPCPHCSSPSAAPRAGRKTRRRRVPPSLRRWSRYRCRWRSPCRDSPPRFSRAYYNTPFALLPR